MKKTTTIFAEALADNRNYKNARMDGKTIGVSESRKWNNAVKAMRIPAYAVAQYRHANLANAEIVAPCDLSALYTALRVILDLVGEVNGAKLHAENIAETVIANASRIRTIDVTVEMAHARNEKREAEKALREFDQNAVTEAVCMQLPYIQKQMEDGKMTSEEVRAWEFSMTYEGFEARLESAKTEVARLESEPNNCKKLFEINSESAFVKAVEIALGDAIIGQCMKSAEQVAAEEEAKRQERRAKTAAKKAAKKAQAKIAA